MLQEKEREGRGGKGRGGKGRCRLPVCLSAGVVWLLSRGRTQSVLGSSGCKRRRKTVGGKEDEQEQSIGHNETHFFARVDTKTDTWSQGGGLKYLFWSQMGWVNMAGNTNQDRFQIHAPR